MRVRVLFFGVLKDLVGKAEDSIELSDGASVRDVLDQYASRFSRFSDSLNSLAVAVNQQYAGPDTILKSSDEVAFLPPVSGGASDGIATADSGPTSPPGSGPLHGRIVRAPIGTQQTVATLKREDDGAVVTFEGIVRNQTRGRRTLYLNYEAYEDMALQQLEQLAADALGKYQIRDLAIVHRLGRLEIGETSVLIAVVSAHRAAAFDACRWVIDTLKRTVPIWKKEYFEDGAVWADGEPFPAEIPRANS